MSRRIAIDFGTERTKVAHASASTRRPELLRFGDAYLPFTPSIFYLPPDSTAMQFGEDAEAMVEIDPAGVVDVPKQRRRAGTVRAGNGRTAPYADLLRFLLADLRAKAGAQIAEFRGTPPDEAVLTVPVMFGSAEGELLADAARAAGFANIRLVAEPIAAAHAWLGEAPGAFSEALVIDCGGGTVEWALVQMRGNAIAVSQEFAPGGISDLGLRDIDQGLLELIEARLEAADISVAEFSSARRARALHRVRLAREAVGSGLEPKPFIIGNEAIKLTASDIGQETHARFVTGVVSVLGPLVQRLAGSRGGSLPPALLVGGGVRIPELRDAIQSIGFTVPTWHGSEYAAAIGALAMTQDNGLVDMFHPPDVAARPADALADAGRVFDFSVNEPHLEIQPHDTQSNDGDDEMALIDQDNLNKELLTGLLDQALINYSIDSDGDIVVDDEMSFFVSPSENRIIFWRPYVFEDHISQDKKLDIANSFNAELKTVRAAVQKNGRLFLDSEIIVTGGVTAKAVIAAMRLFSRTAQAGIRNNYDSIK